ncbi:hypothetical protein BV96_00666 [Sphingomonas paucimobilis]|nr:hypothetical protein BV96_00666 [Sphingomonas paucimobilis]
MRLDQQVERHQGGGTCAHLIGQGGKAQIHPFPGIAITLAVERLMRAELLEQQHRQEAGAKEPARRDVKWCRRLSDLLTIPAGELLPHGLDHLPLARHDLKCLGDILAQLAQPFRAAAGAGIGRGNDDAFAWQMLGQGLAGGPLALEGRDVGLRRCQRSQELIFAGSGLALLERQFHLVEQVAGSFRSLAIKGATHLLVLEFKKGVAGFQVGVDRLDAGDFSGNSLSSGKPLTKAVDLCLRLVPHAPRHSRKAPESLAF